MGCGFLIIAICLGSLYGATWGFITYGAYLVLSSLLPKKSGWHLTIEGTNKETGQAETLTLTSAPKKKGRA